MKSPLLVGLVLGLLWFCGFYFLWRRGKQAGASPAFKPAPASDADKEWLSTYSYRDKRTGEIVNINPT